MTAKAIIVIKTEDYVQFHPHPIAMPIKYQVKEIRAWKLIGYSKTDIAEAYGVTNKLR